MERLTKRNEKGHVQSAIDCPNGCEYFFPGTIGEGPNCNRECEADAMIKLCDYEDAEEQGLLVRLPCKVGGTVWYVGEKYVNDYEVRNIVINETGIAYIKMAKKIDGEDYWLSCHYEDFGVRAFLSEAEAEQALADKGV